jgi:hypothetical protein
MCLADVIFRATRSRATASKSSNVFTWFAFSACVCHDGPNSPPPDVRQHEPAALQPELAVDPAQILDDPGDG